MTLIARKANGCWATTDSTSEFATVLGYDAVTPAAVRRNVAGTRRILIDALSVLPIHIFANPVTFAATLDQQTLALSAIRNPDIPWGTARKCLNIFLRDVTYNVFTRTHYGLDAIQAMLEVPLDSRVAEGLRNQAQQLVVPIILPAMGAHNKTYPATAYAVPMCGPADRTGNTPYEPRSPGPHLLPVMRPRARDDASHH